MPTLDGDGPCQGCGGDNIVWFTASVFWNAVIRSDPSPWNGEPVLCIRCFVGWAERRGFQPTGWELQPDWPWRMSEEAEARRHQSSVDALTEYQLALEWLLAEARALAGRWRSEHDTAVWDEYGYTGVKQPPIDWFPWEAVAGE